MPIAFSEVEPWTHLCGFVTIVESPSSSTPRTHPRHRQPEQPLGRSPALRMVLRRQNHADSRRDQVRDPDPRAYRAVLHRAPQQQQPPASSSAAVQLFSQIEPGC